MIGVFTSRAAPRFAVTFSTGPTVRTLVCAKQHGRNKAANQASRRALHQFLDSIFKIILARQTNVRCRNLSVPIDQKRGPQLLNTALHLRRLIAALKNSVVDREVRHERLNHSPALFVHRNADDREAPLLILALEIDEPGDFDFTRTAPGGPEIEQNDFTFIVGEPDGLSVGVLQSEFGRWLALVISLHKRIRRLHALD